MIKIIQEFLVVSIIVFSLNMIYLYFKNRSKKFKKTLPIEVIYLIRKYNIDIDKIEKRKIEIDTSIVNSIIITIDLLIYSNVKDLLLSILIIFVSTFVLIIFLYNILANIYKKNMR